MRRDDMRAFAAGWDRLAQRYAEELFDELEGKPYDRQLLARFAALVPAGEEVIDLGCGPGHLSSYLAELGLRVRGIDLCPSMIEVARFRSPELSFEVGDMMSLGLEPRSIGGAVLFYSLINLLREDVTTVLQSLAAAMVPGAPLAVAVHAGEGFVREESVFGEPVPMAATLFTLDEMSGYVSATGFQVEMAEERPPYDTEYPSTRVYVLAMNGTV